MVETLTTEVDECIAELEAKSNAEFAVEMSKAASSTAAASSSSTVATAVVESAACPPASGSLLNTTRVMGMMGFTGDMTDLSDVMARLGLQFSSTGARALTFCEARVTKTYTSHGSGRGGGGGASRKVRSGAEGSG